MRESKVAPLSGLLFTVLLLARFVIDQNTDFMPPEADVVAYLEEGPLRVLTGAYLGLLAAAALLWFAGTLYRSLRTEKDDAHRLAALALGGGATASTLLGVGAVALIAAAERVSVADAIDPGAAAALFDVSGIAVGNGAPMGLAVMIGAWGLGSLRFGDRPVWQGWVSLLVAVGLLSPFAWVFLAAALAWTAAVGLSVYRGSSAGELSEIS